MAELLGLLASVAGVSTAGIQIVTRLYSSIQRIKGMKDEIENVARKIETLSSVFEEISTVLQFGQEDIESTPNMKISRRAILTISDLVQDSQILYEKIGNTISHQSKLKGQAKWIFRREEVEIWNARISKNISLVTLMMTTLVWAERRRNQVSMLKPTEEQVGTESGPSDDQVTHENANPESSAALSDLPTRIQKHVGETVLNMMNLAKLEEAYDEGAIKLQLPTGEDLEPRHYVYQPWYGGTMRRENPERESLWLSERVNIGDADTLAERFSVMTASHDGAPGEDPDVAGEDDRAEQATELADRLVQDWTNLTKLEETGSWKVSPDQDPTNEATDDPAAIDTASSYTIHTDVALVDVSPMVSAQRQTQAEKNVSHTDTQHPKIKTTDLRALYLSLRSLRNPGEWGDNVPSNSSMTIAERVESEKRRIIESCFAKLDPDGTILEQYITHACFIEDSTFPPAPALASTYSNIENKKPRCVIVSVRRSGQVRMHKARENKNGTFSIGKTWRLDNVSAIQIYDNIVPSTPLESQEKNWASNEGAVFSIGKRYYWQFLTKKERDFFLLSLIKIYKKYTGGLTPLLEGFGDAERELIAKYTP